MILLFLFYVYNRSFLNIKYSVGGIELGAGKYCQIDLFLFSSNRLDCVQDFLLSSESVCCFIAACWFTFNYAHSVLSTCISSKERN